MKHWSMILTSNISTKPGFALLSNMLMRHLLYGCYLSLAQTRLGWGIQNAYFFILEANLKLCLAVFSISSSVFEGLDGTGRTSRQTFFLVVSYWWENLAKLIHILVQVNIPGENEWGINPLKPYMYFNSVGKIYFCAKKWMKSNHVNKCFFKNV